MPTAPQSDPAPRPDSTASYPASAHPAAPPHSSAGSSSLITLSPVAPSSSTPNGTGDDSPTVITSTRRESDALPAVTPGSRLGHFELIEAVGAGGMAAVLRAKDQELGREVALKILPSHMAADPENVVRFKQEARAAARLDHDNIARVFFCGEDRGQHFIAFEFVEGENLRTLIERRGTLPAGECIRYMAQVAAGLAHAAERGVVHRDVKPSNIVVTPDGKAKLVDMGLARSLHGQSVNGGVTQSGVTLGTFDYISPEQAIDPRRADVRSDIYSLGCAFYHALTGRPPVPEGTAAKKLSAHQNDPITDPRVLNPAVPDELAAVLAKMMAKDPARRYQTPAELIADLRTVAGRLHLPFDGLPGHPSENYRPGAAVGLPADPIQIPLGWVAGLAGVVVAVAVVVGSTTGPTVPAVPLAGDRAPGTAKAAEPQTPIPAEGPPTVDTPTAARVESPATAEEFAKALTNPSVAEIRLTRGKEYDLNSLGRGLVVERSVRIVGAAGSDAPAVRVAVGSADDGRASRPGTLTFRRAEAVEISGVRFELVDSAGADDQPFDPVGIAALGVRGLTVDGCQFVAPDLGAASAAGLAVAADPRPGRPTDLTVTHCFFDVRRSVGIRLTGKVRARVGETGFAPHQAGIELEADANGAAAEPANDLRLTHCTFLLDYRGAAVRAEYLSRWAVSAGFCAFAAPPPDPDGMAMMMADPGDRRPAVLRVEAERPGPNATFNGRPGEPNAYYRVDPVVAGSGPGALGYSFAACREFGDPPPAADPGAIELAQSPWESADPAFDLTGRTPWRALRLKTTFRKVQVAVGDHYLLGARFKPNRDGLVMYDAWPPPRLGSDAAVNPREKVWFPAGGDRLAANEFEALDKAVAALRSGDTLLIRHDGLLEVPPVAFDRSKGPVAVRPHPDSVGLILTPQPGFRLDPGAFRVNDGELTLEKLEFRGRAVSVAGGGRCTLRDCVVTLPDAGIGRAAAVVLLTESEARIAGGRRPAVAVENCLIRGRGAAVWVQSSRPFDLDVKNTVAALAGPLVAVDPLTRLHPQDASAAVALSQVTAVLTGPVLDLRPGKPVPAAGTVNWVPVEVSAGRCAFAPLDPRQPAPLAAVAPTADPPDPARYLKWAAVGRPNWYARSADSLFLELIPADGMVDPLTEKAAGWFRFTKERPTGLGSVAFAAGPQTQADLAAVTADKLLITRGPPGAELGDAGADVKLIAVPSDEVGVPIEQP